MAVSEPLGQVHDAIDALFDRHVAEVQRFVRQPSVSATGEGIAETAAMVADRIRALGADAEVVPTAGHPIVAGRLDVGAPRTLVFYELYDVQPAEGSGWVVAPFSGGIQDLPGIGRSIVSRGAFNSKGPLVGFLNTLEAFQHAGIPLPVNLRFLVEGEEELGSPNLRPFMEEHRRWYDGADAAYLPFFGQDLRGKPIIYLGLKGLVYVELACRGAAWGGPATRNIHGMHAAWVHSPLARLANALALLIDGDGGIRPAGLTEDAQPPTAEDDALMADLARTFDADAQRRELDVSTFKYQDPVEALRRYLFRPSINIDGLWGGYAGPGSKTVVPHEGFAKVHVRLTVGMTPDRVLDFLRRHLNEAGFPEVELRVLARYGPYKTTRSEPVVKALIQACAEVSGRQVELWPLRAGAAPMHLFPDLWGIPLAFGGLGSGGRAHSVNEYITLDGLRAFQRGVAAFLMRYGRQR